MSQAPRHCGSKLVQDIAETTWNRLGRFASTRNLNRGAELLHLELSKCSGKVSTSEHHIFKALLGVSFSIGGKLSDLKPIAFHRKSGHERKFEEANLNLLTSQVKPRMFFLVSIAFSNVPFRPDWNLSKAPGCLAVVDAHAVGAFVTTALGTDLKL